MCRPELVCKEIFKFDLIFKKLAGWSNMDPTTGPKFLIMNVQPVAEYCSTSNWLYCSSRLEAWTSFGQQICNVPIPSSYQIISGSDWVCTSSKAAESGSVQGWCSSLDHLAFIKKQLSKKYYTTTVHNIIQSFCYINNYIWQESWSDDFILGQLFAAHR
jgi:hypothetical protein